MCNVKPYRVKHIPTGLYYKPNSHLSKKGKVYLNNSNVLTYFSGDFVILTLDVNKRLYSPFKVYFEKHKFHEAHTRNATYKIPKTDFETESI